jgi:hypothetical protein
MDNDMTFNFDQIIDRRASDSAKWNYFAADVLPMWVADMDFTAPPAVIEALQARIAHGVFGYGMDSKPLRELLAARMEQLYRWQVAPEDIVLLPGLVCGLNVVSAAIGAPGDGVLTNTPVYGPFLTAPVNQGRVLQSAPLACRASGQELYYTLDMAATAAAVQPNTRLFLLCNPHNPVGRAYTRAELQEIADLCARNDLVICSDEIHCDLLLDETQHIPIAALDPATAARTVTLMAPSKTYNVPGLGASFAIVQDKELRQRVERRCYGHRAPRQHSGRGGDGSGLSPRRRLAPCPARVPHSQPRFCRRLHPRTPAGGARHRARGDLSALAGLPRGDPGRHARRAPDEGSAAGGQRRQLVWRWRRRLCASQLRLPAQHVAARAGAVGARRHRTLGPAARPYRLAPKRRSRVQRDLRFALRIGWVRTGRPKLVGAQG